MPYKLKGNCVVNSETGKTVKCHDTHAQAVAHLRALYANVPDAGGKSMSIKHGAIHGAQADSVQAIHDHAANLGAACADDMTAAAGKAMKFYDQPLSDQMNYAIAEAWDISDTCQAIGGLASLAQGEIGQAEPVDAGKVISAMRTLLDFLSGEIDEMEQALSAGNGANAGAGTNSPFPEIGVPGDYGKSRSAKVITTREDVSAADRVRAKQEYGDVSFADEKNKKYPIDTEDHIRAAWNYINKSDNAGKYSADEVAAIKRKIVAAWKDKIDKAGPPSASDGKSIAIPAYVKSLHLPYDEQKFKDILAVKFIGHDEIMGYSNLWGDEQKVDVELDFFTAQTDFWDDRLGVPRPLTWDHAQDKQFKGHPVIGSALEFGDDEVGKWYHAALDRKGKYLNYLQKMIDDREIGSSSDSAPQYVERVKTKSGANWIKQWPLFAVALTTTPAEPRMFDTVIWKSLGLNLDQFAEAVHEAPREEIETLTRRYELLKRIA